MECSFLYVFFDNFLYNMKEATVDQKIMKN